MKIYFGDKGLDKTWQADFKKNIKCIHCGANSRIGFVTYEAREKEYLCNLYEPEEDKLWLHDACAVAVYFCEKCLQPTAEYNQA